MHSLLNNASSSTASWSLSTIHDAIISPPYTSKDSAEDALKEFQKSYPGIRAIIQHIYTGESRQRNFSPVISIKRSDITLDTYRNNPDLAFQVDQLWRDRFIKPDSDINIVPDIKAYNDRMKFYDEKSFFAKLMKRFEEAQLTLDQEPNIRWEQVVNGFDLSFSASEEFYIEQYNITGCTALGSPEALKEDMEIGTASTQGRRQYNEDRLLLGQLILDKRTIPYFAVFDGHGGSFTSAALKKLVPECIDAAFIMPNHLKNPLVRDRLIFEGLKTLFVHLGRTIENSVPNDPSGSTAVLACIFEGSLWVVNVGDSRAILICNGKAIALSMDADLKSDKDCRSVWKRGQNVFITDYNGMRRVGTLNMARAVKHKELVSGVNPRGQIIKYELDNLEKGRNYLLLASDGLFDVATSKQVAERVDALARENYSCVKIANELVENALDAYSTDNISIVVVKL